MLAQGGARHVKYALLAVLSSALVIVLAEKAHWLFVGLAGPVPLVVLAMTASGMSLPDVATYSVTFVLTSAYLFTCIAIGFRLYYGKRVQFLVLVLAMILMGCVSLLIVERSFRF